jgi:protein-serine/threonine kinase
VLYNRILLDPWDEMFSDPRLKGATPADYSIDPTTYHFIDAVGCILCLRNPSHPFADGFQLLQKDPMRRLTEPCVKEHPYFAFMYVRQALIPCRGRQSQEPRTV